MNQPTMTTEFTTWCSYYYKLTQLLALREARFNNLLNNAPVYSGQTRLSEIDAIISYYRNVQADKAKMDKTIKSMNEAERTILAIMRYFEIPYGTVLTGEIPGQLEYEVCAGVDDSLYISKTKDLALEADGAEIIEIRFSGGDGGDGD